MDVRRQERTRLIYHLRVFDARSRNLLGQLVDITPEGMMLIGEHPVQLERTFSLRMDLPRVITTDNHLAFTAESKWCKTDGNGEFYSMGFRLVKISPKGLELVQRLARDFYQESEDGEDPEVDQDLAP